MSGVVFANQPPDIGPASSQLQRLLDWLAGQAETSARPGWALLDAALFEPLPLERFIAERGDRISNTLAGSALSAFGEYAPRLLRLPADPEARAQDVRELLELAGSATAVSFLRSDARIAELHALCAWLAQARVESRKEPIHCRFADTRVLRELLHVLDSAQHARVLESVEGWAWFERTGGFHHWPEQVPASGIAAASSSCLHLGIDQFRAMQQAAEGDGMFLLLSQNTPELVPAQERGLFHGQLRYCLRSASDKGIGHAGDRLQFLVLSLSYGDDFHWLPALQDTWAATSRGERLGEHVKQWDDAIWQQLQAHKEKRRG